MKIFDKSKMTPIRKTVIMAFLVCVGIVLQLVESMFDIFIVPGGKVGLANIASVICLFIFGGANSVMVAFLRAVLGCLLYGGVMAMPYSVGGAVLSALCMWGLKAWLYPRLSQIGISVLGAFAHNTAQILVAVAIFKNVRLFTYLPVLIIIGTVGGVVTGIGAKYFCKKTGIERI